MLEFEENGIVQVNDVMSN